MTRNTAVVCALYENKRKAENDIDWPAQSPDANPIENVWSIFKRKFEGKRVYTLMQLLPCPSYLVIVTAAICGKSYRKYAKTVPANSQ